MMDKIFPQTQGSYNSLKTFLKSHLVNCDGVSFFLSCTEVMAIDSQAITRQFERIRARDNETARDSVMLVVPEVLNYHLNDLDLVGSHREKY